MTEETKQLRAIARLLAYHFANEKESKDSLLQMAYEKEEETVKVDQVEDPCIEDQVKKIYNLYPARCPNRGTSTGKCSKDVEKIRRLIKKRGFVDVLNTTIAYIQDCIDNKSYLKNFSTFLNNFPDTMVKETTLLDEDQHYR